MVTDSRHRHQISWTSFDTSPFFGVSHKNMKDAVLDWPPSMIGRHGMQSTSPHKRSSVATATTASTSASTLKEGYLYSPTIAHEFQLDSSMFATNAQDKDNVHDYETDFSDREPLSNLQRQRNRRNSPDDPCLPIALDDLREMATASMNKAMSFWSQIQDFLHQKFNNEDAKKTMSRLSCTTSSRPTTVFIIPAMESEPKPNLFSGLESLADSLTNPTFLDDDYADDMSSLTEPPVIISKSLPPMVRYRNAPAQKWTNEVSDQTTPNDFDFYDEVDDYIEFESENRDTNEKRSPRVSGPLVDATTDFPMPKKTSLQAARSSLSRRFRTFLPSRKSHNQTIRSQSTRSPLLNQEIQNSESFESKNLFQTEPRDLPVDSVSC